MKRKSVTDKVLDGLRGLAFGSINDAVALVFSDEMPCQEQLQRMKLGNVSSIKRVKGGGVEVQFFDRQKALERLYEYAHAGENGAAAESLLHALMREDHNAL